MYARRANATVFNKTCGKCNAERFIIIPDAVTGHYIITTKLKIRTEIAEFCTDHDTFMQRWLRNPIDFSFFFFNLKQGKTAAFFAPEKTTLLPVRQRLTSAGVCSLNFQLYNN